MTPDELINEYKKEILRVYGTERLNRSEFYFYGGWYYINLARKSYDGKYGLWSLPNCVRRKELVKMISEFADRQSFDETNA